jgi:hypothetical protein
MNAKGFNVDDLTLIAEEAHQAPFADITLDALEILFTSVIIGPRTSGSEGSGGEKALPLPSTSIASFDPIVILRTLIQLAVGLLPARKQSTAIITPTPTSTPLSRHNTSDTKENKSASTNYDGNIPMDVHVDGHGHGHDDGAPDDDRTKLVKLMQRIEKYFGWVREQRQQRIDRRIRASTIAATATAATGSSGGIDDAGGNDDTRWFAEQSWNIGLRAANERLFSTCHTMFDHASWLFHQLPTSASNHDSYRMSEVMVMASALEQAWLAQGDQRQSLASDAIARAANIMNTAPAGATGTGIDMSSLPSTRVSINNDKLVGLTKLLLIKARLFLNDKDIVMTIKKMSPMDVHIYDGIAALAMQFGRADGITGKSYHNMS